MVRLSKIYTKTGDDGTTGLGDGSRVPKTDLRVEAYGTVDEANAALGLCVVEITRAPVRLSASMSGPDHRMAALLGSIQNDLFDVGADLCTPISSAEKPGERLRVTGAQSVRLEHSIDEYNASLKPLDSFVLPGGTPLAASLHLARTIARRAERLTVALTQRDPARTNPETVIYLNRLSDLLFVLARVANNDGAQDVKWKPGASRSG